MDQTRNCPPNRDPRAFLRRAIERIRARWGSSSPRLVSLALVGLTPVSLALEIAHAGPSPPSTHSVKGEPLFYARIHRDEKAVLSGMAHDHVVRATRVEAVITLDEQAPARCLATLLIPVRSLLVDEPAWRKRVGLDGHLDEQDRKSVREHMLAPDQLDAGRFPVLRASVDRCRKGDTPGSYRGDLHISIRGKTQSFRGAALVTTKGGQLECRGELRLKHSDFGIEPYSAFLGTVRNADRFEVHWSVVAQRARPTESDARPGP